MQVQNSEQVNPADKTVIDYESYEYPTAEDEEAVEREFERHGVKVGEVTYLHADTAFLQRVRDRIQQGVPLPHEDDESLERFLLFRFLTKEQQAQVKAVSDPIEKRRSIERFLNENDENDVVVFT